MFYFSTVVENLQHNFVIVCVKQRYSFQKTNIIFTERFQRVLNSQLLYLDTFSCNLMILYSVLRWDNSPLHLNLHVTLLTLKVKRKE